MYSGATNPGAKIPKTQHPPVILFLSNQANGRDAVDEWLTQSRYTTFEAVDVFQALEYFSDFTMAERPDVIFLHVESPTDDLVVMQTMVETAEGEADVPIIDFAGELSFVDDDKDFSQAMAKLVCWLDEFIPHHSVARV